jgi:signal transduction histidine kinase
MPSAFAVFEEVLINLLNNAAKYTPDGERIEVWCESIPDDKFVQVRVRDNGVRKGPTGGATSMRVRPA